MTDIPVDSLLPCPFCGSHANTYSMPGFCRVQCTSCAAQVETEPTCGGLTYAKNLWNRRFFGDMRDVLADQVRQKAQGSTDCAFLMHVADEIERLRLSATARDELLRDFADYGLRFDLNPTVHLSPVESVHGDYLHYIRRMDASVRERARAVIDKETTK